MGTHLVERAERALVRLTRVPRTRREGWRTTGLVLLVLVPVGTSMVLVGNRLLGQALLALLGPRPAVQLAAGLLVVVAGLALWVCSDLPRRLCVGRRMRWAGAVLLVLAFLVQPVGRGAGATGAAEGAPWVGLGALLGLPVGLLGLWLARLPWRRRRDAAEAERVRRDREAQLARRRPEPAPRRRRR